MPQSIMVINNSENKLAEFLSLSGSRVINVDNISWQVLNGFVMPCYLPHCIPDISYFNAKNACKLSGSLFVRWTGDFGKTRLSSWWFIIYEGYYSLENCKSKTRWQVNKGNKRLLARKLEAEEVLAQGYDVCKRACERYGDRSFLVSREHFRLRINASTQFPGIVEYFGVFNGLQLVALAENLVQDNAVFWESIWFDPAELKNHSSYVLTDFMLNHYINERKFTYVSDGSRSIYHNTNFQLFLIEKFGFKKQYTKLYFYYSPLFFVLVSLLFPLRKVFHAIARVTSVIFLRKLSSILLQEEIRRAN